MFSFYRTLSLALCLEHIVYPHETQNFFLTYTAVLWWATALKVRNPQGLLDTRLQNSQKEEEFIWLSTMLLHCVLTLFLWTISGYYNQFWTGPKCIKYSHIIELWLGVCQLSRSPVSFPPSPAGSIWISHLCHCNGKSKMSLSTHLRYLLQVESMWDVVRCEKGRDQMSDWSSFSTMGTELEGAQSKLSTDQPNTKGHDESFDQYMSKLQNSVLYCSSLRW